MTSARSETGRRQHSISRGSIWLLATLITICIQGEPHAQNPVGPVTYQRIVRAEDEPGNWLTYSGQYHSQRYSRLDQINAANVRDLRVKWVRQFNTLARIETSPLVVDGMMYATLPHSVVVALDAKTGLQYWKYEHPLSDQVSVCCGPNTRGVGILGDTLYLGTLDSRLVALDARSGQVRWNVEVADNKAGYSITGAPLVIKDMVITGIAGGEYGIRGFIDAYDAATGARRWRTYTIPGPGEPGHETWAGDSWTRGGSPTWLTGSFDPQLNLLYWGVGNPGPDWNGEVREGDNLYSDCVLALDADTGRIRWHFQFTPHDVHDWDACQIPVLADAEFRGRQRKLMLWGNRNAFFYVLDRETGEFLLARDYARQTWAERIDESGRPQRLPNTFPSKEGTLVWPDLTGATNWWSPSYSPQTKLFYVMSYDGPGRYFLGEAEYTPGQQFTGGFGTVNEELPGVSPYVSAVRALDPSTGERKWEYRVQPRSTSGLLTTAGNLLFGGTVKGTFFALDARTGGERWRLDIGGNVHAAPITYLVDGQQYVTIAAGSALFTFGL